MKNLLQTIAMSWLSVLLSYGQDGELDTSFGSDGVVLNHFGEDGLSGKDLVVQTDGKILVLSNLSGEFVSSDIVLSRYLLDGTLDPTFGTNGLTKADVNGFYDSGESIILQKDGKILVGGWTESGVTANNNIDFLLLRFNQDGSLDTSFDLDGIVVSDFFGLDDHALDLVLQKDGKILLAGASDTPNTSSDFFLARYDVDGSLDSTFNTDGKLRLDFGASYDIATNVGLRSDGKIVIAGYAQINGTGAACAFACFHPDGTLDGSFGEDGFLLTNAEGMLLKMLVLEENKILAFSTGPNGNTLTKYDKNGLFDSTFGSGGSILLQVNNPSTYMNDLVMQSDGKFVLAGVDSEMDPPSSLIVARYDIDGSIDSTFGNDGFAFNSPTNESSARRVVLQEDGKIIICGKTGNMISEQLLLTRFTNPSIEKPGNSLFTITLFPNPASKYLTIKSEDEYIRKLEIFNLQGELVKLMETNSPEIELDLSNLKAANYLLTIYSENESETYSFVLE